MTSRRVPDADRIERGLLRITAVISAIVFVVVLVRGMTPTIYDMTPDFGEALRR